MKRTNVNKIFNAFSERRNEFKYFHFSWHTTSIAMLLVFPKFISQRSVLSFYFVERCKNAGGSVVENRDSNQVRVSKKSFSLISRREVLGRYIHFQP